jgi:hypothetical protein
MKWSRTAYDKPHYPQLTDRRFPQHPEPFERNVIGRVTGTASTQ